MLKGVSGGSNTVAFPGTVTGGVSGGIPYFTSTTAWASSALLAANAVVIGGGSGTAPYTTAFLTVGATGIVMAGAGGSKTVPALTLSGSTTSGFSGVYANQILAVANSKSAWRSIDNDPYAMQFTSTGGISWNSATDFDTGARDTAISRVSAGVAGVGTGAAGSVAGQLHAGMLQTSLGTALTLTQGAIGMSKMTASGTAPGASGAKLEIVAGTNAGTAKLIMYAGTSGTAVTIIDNVGAGVT